MDRALRRVLESLARTADGVFAIDNDYRIVFWSGSARELLGFSPEDVLGRPCYEVVHGLDSDGTLWCQQNCPVIRRIREGGLFPNYDVLTHRKDGSPVWLNISIVCLPQGKGLPAMPVHIFREVTGRKRKERLAEGVARLVHQEGLGAEPAPTQGPLPPLSRREWEVLTLLARGHNVERIAGALSLQPVTVRNYIQRILNKLGVHSRAEAIAWLYRRGQSLPA